MNKSNEKIILKVQKANTHDVFSMAQAIHKAVPKEKEEVLSSLLNDIIGELPQKGSVNLLSFLEYFARNKSDLLNNDVISKREIKECLPLAKDTDFIFPGLLFKYLDKDFLKSYLINISDISFIGGPLDFGKDKSGLWIEKLSELLSDRDILFNVLKIFAIGKAPWVYLPGYDSNYNDSISKVRRELFRTMLKTIKENISMFVAFSGFGDYVSQSYQVAIYDDFSKLVQLISSYKNNEIVEITDFESFYENIKIISWFADKPEELLKKIGVKLPRYYVGDLMIEAGSDLLDTYFDKEIEIKSVDVEHIAETRGLYKKNNQQIWEELLSGSAEWYDIKYYVEYLLKSGVTLPEIQNELLKEKTFSKTKGDILYSLYEKEKKWVMNILRDSNFHFISADLLVCLEREELSEYDLYELLKVFNAHYYLDEVKMTSMNTIVNSFEGRLIDLLINKTVKEKKYTELTKNIVSNINARDNLQGYVLAFKFALDIYFNVDDIVNSSEDVKVTFVETISWKFEFFPKLFEDWYIELLVTYFSSKELKDKNTPALNCLIYYIRDIEFEKYKKLLVVLEEKNVDFFQLSNVLFKKNFKLQNHVSFRKLKDSSFYKKILTKKCEWVLSLWGHNENKFFEEFDRNLIIEGIKSLNTISIQPYDFQSAMWFAIENDFSEDEIVNMFDFLKKPDPREMVRVISAHHSKSDVLDVLVKRLSKTNLDKLISVLRSRSISIPDKLIVLK